MNSLALSLAIAMGHTATQEVRVIASALERACQGDTSCVLDGAVYAERESAWQLTPRPWSWDAKAGLARGPWQLWNAPASLPDQARAWVHLRELSLTRYGDMRGLAGANAAGVRIARARADEAEFLEMTASAWGRP